MITEQELRDAYTRTAFHRIGIPFEAAVQRPGLRAALEASAKAARRRVEAAA